MADHVRSGRLAVAIDGIYQGRGRVSAFSRFFVLWIVCNIIRTKGFGPVALFGFVNHPMGFYNWLTLCESLDRDEMRVRKHWVRYPSIDTNTASS